jgi:hypothetical protein
MKEGGKGKEREKKRNKERRDFGFTNHAVYKHYFSSSFSLCLHEILLQQVGGYEL